MKNISRREALKFMGALGIVTAGGVGITKAQASTTKSKEIVIIGAGLGGLSLLNKLLKMAPKSTITIIDDQKPLYYQPGFTLIGAGVYGSSDVTYNKGSYIGKNVNWIKELALAVDPDRQMVTTASRKQIGYDYLVLATGGIYDFGSIEGLSAKDVGKNGICTIYTKDGAIYTNELRKESIKNGGTFVFAEPKTPFKCAGANKKINFLVNDSDKDKKVKTILYSGSPTMFSTPVYAKLIESKFLDRDMEYRLSHHPIKIDKEQKIIYFERTFACKDEHQTQTVEQKYDYLHFVPRLKVPDFVKEAGLSVTSGDVEGNWVDVKKQTLQHKRYKNIFAIGDCCGIPMGKTGASIRKMYPVVAQNIVDDMEGLEPSASYDGYTACPLLTRYGKAILVEFDWKAKPKPSFECFGATRESYMIWAMKIYAMKPMVMQGMLRALA